MLGSKKLAVSGHLSGLNCAPVAIQGTKNEFLEWIGAGSQDRPDPNPFTVDRRGNAVGLPASFGVRPMAITTLEEYLREFSVEIGDRILTSFPLCMPPASLFRRFWEDFCESRLRPKRSRSAAR